MVTVKHFSLEAICDICDTPGKAAAGPERETGACSHSAVGNSTLYKAGLQTSSPVHLA